MRWFRYGVLAVLLLLGIYALLMYYFVDESKTFTVEKEVNYPVEKVFPQFNNLQNFSRWNAYFSDSKKMALQFYEPYEGPGASMSFTNAQTDRSGEMFVRYVNPNHTLKYQLFETKKGNPYNIGIKFSPSGTTHTKITWYVQTPRQPLLLRSANFFSEGDFLSNLDASMNHLSGLLSNKMDKDEQLAAIKFDSLMVENTAGQLLLGINVSASNQKQALFKNIILNHNKVYNFVTVDLGKQDDEFGLPMLLTDASNYKDKEVSYFYGLPLPRRVGISDNNFLFRSVNPSKSFVIYYKGKYEGRVKAVQQLLQKAKKDTLRNGELQQTFLEAPSDGKDVAIKLALPVYR